MFPKDEFVFWDIEKKYVYNKLSIYYQTNSCDIQGKGTNYKKKVWKKIDPKLPLKNVLILPEHIIPQIPILTIFVTNSSYEKEFLEKEKE